MNGPLKATKLGERANSSSAVRNQPSVSIVSASMLAINLPRAARHPALRAAASPRCGSSITITPGVDEAMRRVPSLLLLLTTMISALQPDREISAWMAARHEAIRTCSLYAGTTKLTSTSDISDLHC